MLIKFKVCGNLRFLSHAETVRVFQRACVRAGIKIKYSQGFNPRPKLSLPLPRSVGVESDDELLCLETIRSSDELQTTNYESQIKAGLSSQLPHGCELLSVSATGKKDKLKATSTTYILVVRQEYFNDDLKARVKHLLASGELNFHRQKPADNWRLPKSDFKHKMKLVNVRPFLESTGFEGRNIIVRCKVSSNGSIRIDEILKLLKLDVEKLAAPIRRTKVEWQEL